MNWSKESALSQIDTLISELRNVRDAGPRSAEHTRWLFRTRTFFSEVFGETSEYFTSLTNLHWGLVGVAMVGGPSRPQEARNPQLGVDRVEQEAFQKAANVAEGILLAARDELERSNIDELYKGHNSPPEASVLMRVFTLAERKLRKVVREAPTTEKEVQDAFENLLVGADVRYAKEAERVQYSSKTYVPDFTISTAELAVEIKLCASSGREKALIGEINDDILAYRRKYPNVVFIVYDVNQIRDVDQFKEQFEEQEGVVVLVVKH